jgi:hypothetical protein
MIIAKKKKPPGQRPGGVRKARFQLVETAPLLSQAAKPWILLLAVPFRAG